MPFRRRRRRRARRGRSTAVKALKLARRAWRATDHEMKLIDGNFNSFALADTANAALLLISGIAQGDGRNERIGERCSLRRLEMRFAFSKDPGSAADDVIRFMVIWDRQPNAGLATVANVLENIGLGSRAANTLSPLDVNNSKRFQVLLDRVFRLTVQSNSTRVVRWNLNLKHKTPQYNGAGAAINQINTGALLLLPLGSLAAAANPTLLNGQFRVRFVG